MAQCIQQYVGAANRNHIILGLTVKLYHKHGSKELIKTLNEHDITSTYEEKLSFLNSKFVSNNNQITTRNLS